MVAVVSEQVRGLDAALGEIEGRRDEIVALARDLIRFPTIKPPGEAYRPCAEFLGDRLKRRGFDVTYVRAEGTPGDNDKYPRINVVGRREGSRPGPWGHFPGPLAGVGTGGGGSL